MMYLCLALGVIVCATGFVLVHYSRTRLKYPSRAIFGGATGLLVGLSLTDGPLYLFIVVMIVIGLFLIVDSAILRWISVAANVILAMGVIAGVVWVTDLVGPNPNERAGLPLSFYAPALLIIVGALIAAWIPFNAAEEMDPAAEQRQTVVATTAFCGELALLAFAFFPNGAFQVGPLHSAWMWWIALAVCASLIGTGIQVWALGRDWSAVPLRFMRKRYGDTRTRRRTPD